MIKALWIKQYGRVAEVTGGISQSASFILCFLFISSLDIMLLCRFNRRHQSKYRQDPAEHIWSACNSSPAPQLAPLTCPAVMKVETQLLEAALTPDPLWSLPAGSRHLLRRLSRLPRPAPGPWRWLAAVESALAHGL